MKKSCIQHPEWAKTAEIHEGYVLLFKNQQAAVLMWVIQQLADRAIRNGAVDYPVYLGTPTLREMEEMAAFAASNKRIRQILEEFEQLGYIVSDRKPGQPSHYWFYFEDLQRDLDQIDSLGQAKPDIRPPSELLDRNAKLRQKRVQSAKPLELPPIRTTKYKKNAEAVFRRDGGACVYCGATEDLTLDHLIPQSRGGSHTADNLACCCATCNTQKRAKTPEEWLGVGNVPEYVQSLMYGTAKFQ